MYETTIDTDLNQAEVIFGDMEMEVVPEGFIFVNNGKDEIENYVKTVALPSLQKENKTLLETAEDSLNQYAQTKTNAFNQHTTVKTGEFDNHVSAKQTEFDSYVSTKQTEIDAYASSKKALFDVQVEQINQQIGTINTALEERLNGN